MKIMLLFMFLTLGSSRQHPFQFPSARCDPLLASASDRFVLAGGKDIGAPTFSNEVFIRSNNMDTSVATLALSVGRAAMIGAVQADQVQLSSLWSQIHFPTLIPALQVWVVSGEISGGYSPTIEIVNTAGATPSVTDGPAIATCLRNEDALVSGNQAATVRFQTYDVSLCALVSFSY